MRSCCVDLQMCTNQAYVDYSSRCSALDVMQHTAKKLAPSPQMATTKPTFPSWRPVQELCEAAQSGHYGLPVLGEPGAAGPGQHQRLPEASWEPARLACAWPLLCCSVQAPPLQARSPCLLSPHLQGSRALALASPTPVNTFAAPQTMSTSYSNDDLPGSSIVIQ